MTARFPTCDLGEVADLHDSLHQTPQYVDVGYPMIRVTDIRRGFVETRNAVCVDKETYLQFSKKHKPRIGDILFSRVGSYGNSSYVNSSEEFCLGQNTVCISPDREQVEPFFLYCCLNSEKLRHQIESVVGGASQGTISLKNIRTLQIPFPSVPVQQRIAGILLAYDELMENSQRRIRILEMTARALYREWFVEFRFPGYEKVNLVPSQLGSIPQGWDVKTFDDLVTYSRRATKPGDHLSERRYVPIDCLPSRSLALLEARPIDEAQSSLQLFDHGDILFGAMRPYFHKVVVAPFDGVTRATCFVFKPAKAEWSAFATMTAFEESTIAYANARSQGATIPYAVWDGVLSQMPLILPPPDLLHRFERFVAPMLARVSQAFSNTNNLQRTRDLLLLHLLSGQSVPPVP